MATYKTIRNFSYAKKLKVKPGVHNFKFEGQRVKGVITPDGRSLKIIDGSQSVVKKIKQIPSGMKLVPDGSVLRKRKDSTTSTSTATATRTTATHTTQTQTPCCTRTSRSRDSCCTSFRDSPCSCNCTCSPYPQRKRKLHLVILVCLVQHPF